MPDLITMVLAGGQGTRLFPLTARRSKPAVPIAGKFRLIDVPLSNCIHSNFRRIYILTQFSAESLHRHISQTYRFSIFSQDFITILSAQQTLENRDWYQGTADAVRKNLRFINNRGDYVLILSGDHLYRMDYRKFVDYHIEKGADISIGVLPVTAERAGEFGIMHVDKNAQITKFHEKPKEEELLNNLRVPEKMFYEQGIQPNGRSHLASMGIYVFNKNTLIELLEDTSFSDFGKEVIPFAISGKKVFSYFFDGYWEDIGTTGAFFDAHIELTRPLPQFDFYDEDAPIFSHPRFLPGAKVIGAEIQNSILCDGSIVDPSTIKNSMIGIRSIVGKGCELNEVVMMGADFFETPEQKNKNQKQGIPNVGIGNNCVIRRAIIDKNARVGNNVKLINQQALNDKESEHYVIRDGIIVVAKNTVIPDGTVV